MRNLILSSFALTLSSAAVASPGLPGWVLDECDITTPMEWEVSPDSLYVDVQAPSAVYLYKAEFVRGQAHDVVCGEGPSWDICNMFGTLELQISATDDLSSVDEMGAIIEIVGGAGRLPPLFAAPRGIVNINESIFLPFVDGATSHQEAFEAQIAITVVDGAGNESDPVLFEIFAEGIVPDHRAECVPPRLGE